MNTQKLIGSALAVAGLAAMGMGSARADIIPVFLTSSAVGGITTFTYRVDLTNDQQVAPEVTPGVLSPATDSFVTIYDFAGFVPGSMTVLSGPLGLSNSLLGVNPPFIAAPDSPTVQNLTIAYTGSTTLQGPQTLGFVTAQTTLTGFNTNGFFAAQAQKSIGLSAGTTIDNIGRTTVPAPASTPEPATMVPFALGGLGLLGLIARKTRRTSGAMA